MHSLSPFPRSIPKRFFPPKNITVKKRNSTSNGDQITLVSTEESENDPLVSGQDLHLEIERYFIPKSTKVGDILPIIVGEVYDPSKFWFHVDDEKLDRLMDELQTFYHCNREECIIPESKLEVGLHCVSVFYEEFHRVVIIDISTNSSEIKVYSIDYGIISKVQKCRVWYLHDNFIKLPAQAIRARLAGIYPSSGQATWSRECIVRFRKHSSMKKSVAKISKINWEDQIIEMYIRTLPNSEEINSILVAEQFAQGFSMEVKRNRFKFRHMFPKFSEIENGSELSALEVNNFLEMGLTIDKLCPKYFYQCSFCVKMEENLDCEELNEYEDFCHILNGNDSHKFTSTLLQDKVEKLIDVDIFEGFQRQDPGNSDELDISEFAIKSYKDNLIELEDDLSQLDNCDDSITKHSNDISSAKQMTIQKSDTENSQLVLPEHLTISNLYRGTPHFLPVISFFSLTFQPI